MSELNVSSNFSLSNSSYNLNLGNSSLESVFHFVGEPNGLSSNGEPQQQLVRHSRRKRGLFSLIAHVTIGIVKVVKAAKKAHKAVKRLKNVRRAIQRGKEIFKHGKEIYDQGKEMYKRGKEVIQKGREKVKAIKEGVNAFKDKFGNMKDKYEEIRDKVTGEITGYKEKLSGKITDLKKEVTDKYNEFKGDAKERINQIKEDVNSRFDNVTGKYNDAKKKIKCDLANKIDSIKGGSDEESECIDNPGDQDDNPSNDNDGPSNNNDGPSNDNDGPGESNEEENSESGEGEYEEGEEESDPMADDVKATLDLTKQNNELLIQQSEAINKNYEAIEQNGRNIDRNYDEIKKNGLAIEKNFDAIQHNAELLDRNFEEVQKNGEAIAKNAQAIEQNKELLNQNQELIKENNEAIHHNEDLINRNNEEIQKNGEKIDKNNKEILKNHEAIDRNYKEIKNLEYKVSRSFEVQLKKFAEIQQTMTEALDTLHDVKVEIVDRIEQAEAVILKKINEIATKPTYSKLNSFYDYFLSHSNDIRSLPLDRRISRLEDQNGFMTTLQDSNKPKADTMYTLLWDIINQDFAIPKDKDDQLAFSILEVLCYGMQVYTLIIYFMMEQYGILSENYYFKSDVDQYNNYYRLSRENFLEFTKSLIGSERFLDKITGVLNTVKGLAFVEKDAPNMFEFCKESIKNLEGIRKSLTQLEQTFDPDTPDLMRDDFLDFSNADVAIPYKNWKEEVDVSYAIQFFGNDTVISSFVSRWSDGYRLDEFAYPEVSIPIDPFGRTKTVFRRIDKGAAQMVALIKDSSVTKFKDINRELYDAVLQTNPKIALRDVKFYIEHGADVNAMFEHHRRPIHASAEIGRWSIADILIKNGSNVDVQTDNGYTAIYIATEYGNSEFVQNLVLAGANVSIKTNKEQLELTPLHCASYKGRSDIVQSLLVSDTVDVNAKSSKGQTALHYAASFCKGDVVQLLIADNRTDINPKTDEQMTPLHLAAINNCDNVVQLLSSAQTLNVNAEADQSVTPLHFASTYKNKQVAASLVKLGASRHAITDKGASVVHHAAFGGNADIVSLVASEDNVDTQNDMEMTPLYIAYQFNKTLAANKLIESCANINIVLSKGRTLLHLAAINGDHIAVVNLIKNGISVSAVDDDNRQALYYAVSYNYLSIVYVLLQHGADPNIPDKSNFRCTFLTANLDENAALNMLQLLADFKADLTATTGDNALIHIFTEMEYFSVVKSLIERGVSVDSKGSGNETPLFVAASVGNLDIVKYLVENGANVNSKVDHDETPLHYASRASNWNIVEYLAENGADVNADGIHYERALHIAAKVGNIDMVKFLVEKGADVNVEGIENERPLHIAARVGNLEMVKFLVEKGTNVNIKANHDETPLHTATRAGNLDIFKYLVENGANVNAIGYHSLLYIAVKAGNLDMAKFLIEKGADVNFNGREGENALCTAAREGNLDMVKLLVENGADVDLKENYSNLQWTPLSIAVVKGTVEMVEYLLEKGANIDSKIGENYLISAVLSSNNQKYEIVKLLISKGVDYKNDKTIFFFSCLKGDLNLVKYFHSLDGIDIKVIDDDNNKEMNAIFYAIQYDGQLDLVKYLVDNGVDINDNKKLPYEKTLLVIAIDRNKADVVKYLLEIGVDYTKASPLLVAAKKGNMEIVKHLLEKNLKQIINDEDAETGETALCIAIKQKCDKAVVELMVESGAKLDFKDKKANDNTYVLIAAEANKTDVVMYLIEKGADYNATNNHGGTLLQKAAMNNNFELVKFCLNNVSMPVDAADQEGHTPLYFALDNNADLRVVKLLQSKGADSKQIPKDKFDEFLKSAVEKKKYDLVYHLLKNTTTEYRKDYSLVHMAVEQENVEMLALLLESGEDYNYKDYNNKTSLDFMIENKKDAVIKYFTFNFKDMHGKSMLHNVAARGENAKVEFFLKRGAYINAKDNKGNTPLHLAALGGHLDTVKLLLSQRCANLAATNNDGEDVLYQATYFDHPEVATYLEQKMNELKPKKRRHVESFDDEQTVSSSGLRPSWWVSDAVGSVLNGLKGVAGQVSQLVTAFSESHDEIPKSNSVAFDQQSYHQVDGTIMLLDLIVRTMTKSKFISTSNTNTITLEKARAYALSIVDRFENYILSQHKHNNIKHEFDTFQLYQTIERYTLSGQFDKMEQHLNSIALDIFENINEFDKHLLARNINNLLIETQFESDKSQQICNSQFTSIDLPTNKLASHDITKLIK